MTHPEMITRNSNYQPLARYNEKWQAVELIVPGVNPRVIRLSAAKAEELAIELDHAAKMMRGEV